MSGIWNAGIRQAARGASLLIGLLLVVACAGHGGASAASAVSKKITVYYNDEAMTFTEAPPIIKDGRTLVPFRSLLETLGFEIGWVSGNGVSTASGTKDGLVIELTINDLTARVNGKPVTLDVPAQIVDERTMVPLRFVSENSGYDVAYTDRNGVMDIRISDKKGTANVGDNAAEPYVMKGIVVDSDGRPVMGAKIYADNQLLYNSNEVGVTDANGRYRIELEALATTWHASGEATIRLNGQSSTVSLTPDNDDPFAGNAGAIRNFTLQTATGTVIFHMADLYNPKDITLMPPAQEDVELTLESVGETAGGAGKKYVGHGEVTNDGFGMTSVPIGRYKITARYVPEGEPAQNMLIRMSNGRGEYQEVFEAEFAHVIASFYKIEIEVKLP